MEFTAKLTLIIAIFSLLAAAGCVLRCWRAVSASTSMANQCLERLNALASFESQILSLQSRLASAEKARHLDARRDPDTGRSTPTRKAAEPLTKSEWRTKLGLIGPNAAKVAQSIHQQGGIR